MNGETNSTGTDISLGLGPAAGSSIERGTSGGGKGPIIGTAIIVILLVAGGVFFLANRMKGLDNGNTPATDFGPDDAIIKLQDQGTSTLVSDIEANINNSDLENLDKELGSIEAELIQ